MDMDIRIPIGFLFVILGVILAAFGVFTLNDTELYARSLGRNINLWTGVGMLIFGLPMLIIPLAGRRKKSQEKPQD
jgi:multisubunit Na+/H+ antiporter MnhG subunit